MPYIPPELQEIAKRVAQGEQPQASVRAFISWFSEPYRTKRAVRIIDEALAGLNLRTEPHYNSTYLDGPVKFHRQITAPAVTEEKNQLSAEAAAVIIREDGAPKVAYLPSARVRPVCVAPDSPIEKAITLMMTHNYSQLPATTGERSNGVRGMISWRSLGSRLGRGRHCSTVREVLEDPQFVKLEDSLFDAVRLISKYDSVLVLDSEKKVCGIVTAADIAESFGKIAEPFLLLGEIENRIRNLIDERFEQKELEEARDPLDKSRPLQDVADLNFGGYIRLLQDPSRWDRLATGLDRQTFIGHLEEVRTIRNDVMHFDPAGISGKDLKRLRELANLLRQLDASSLRVISKVSLQNR